MRKNKGITLIVLVVTIIILIILAGISINLVFGEYGIIDRVNIAREETRKSQALEELRLKVLDVQVDKNVELL